MRIRMSAVRHAVRDVKLKGRSRSVDAWAQQIVFGVISHTLVGHGKEEADLAVSDFAAEYIVAPVSDKMGGALGRARV